MQILHSKNFGSTEPVMSGEIHTAIKVDIYFFFMHYKKNFTAFLIRKIVNIVDNIHDFGYFNQVSSLLNTQKLNVTTSHFLASYMLSETQMK